MSLALLDSLYTQYGGRLRQLGSALSDELAGRNLQQPAASPQQFFKDLESPTQLRSVKAWNERVRHNSRLFQTNYLIIVGLFLALYAVTHPVSVVLLAAAAGGCYAALQPKPDLVIQGRTLNQQERLTAAVAISCFVLTVTGVLATLSFNLLLASGTVLTHATVRRVGNGDKIRGLKKRLEKDAKVKIREALD